MTNQDLIIYQAKKIAGLEETVVRLCDSITEKDAEIARLNGELNNSIPVERGAGCEAL
nr:MAG TPA: hypothetical protein [Caudoviricetes sp.]